MSKDELKHTPTIEQVLASVLETNAKLVARLEAIEGGNTAAAAHERMKEAMRPPAPDPEVIRDVLSQQTGCTFDVEIQHGKVYRLLNHRMPAGQYKHVKDGGIVPDGITIFKDKETVQMMKNEHGLDESLSFDSSLLTNAYKGWRLFSMLQPDRLLVGKPFPEHMRPRPTKAA